MKGESGSWVEPEPGSGSIFFFVKNAVLELGLGYD